MGQMGQWGRDSSGRRRARGFSLWSLLIVIVFVIGIALPA